MLNALRFLSVLFTAVGMAGGLAHLFELLNKMTLSDMDYLTVQQIYRGWALLGVADIGALVSTLALATMVRRNWKILILTLVAALCIALGLVVFFMFTYPVNQQTLNWTVLPDNWLQLRLQWEYSHAVNAGLFFVAFNALVLSLLIDRDDRHLLPVAKSKPHHLAR